MFITAFTRPITGHSHESIVFNPHTHTHSLIPYFF